MISLYVEQIVFSLLFTYKHSSTHISCGKQKLNQTCLNLIGSRMSSEHALRIVLPQLFFELMNV